MFFRAKRAVARRWFDWHCTGVLNTPAISATDPSLTCITMLCHGDMMMYLLAIKSFVAQLGRSPHIVVVDDGTLEAADYDTLKRHIVGIDIVHVSAIDHGRCPKGGTWERLLLIAELVKTSYVIQLDADTVTRSAVNEVIDSISANRSFTVLGDRSFPEIEAMIAACARYKGGTHPMIQAVVERSFDQLPEAQSLFYVRGNSGFTGFGKNSVTRNRIEWLSDVMRRLVGERWNEWGTEQITSNLVIANTPGARPLPSPKYVTYWARPEIPYHESAFVHFIGPCRYANNFYINSAQRAIAQLRTTCAKSLAASAR